MSIQGVAIEITLNKYISISILLILPKNFNKNSTLPITVPLNTVLTEIIVTGASNTIRNLVLCNITCDIPCVYIHLNPYFTFPANKLYVIPCIISCTKVIGIINNNIAITLSK